MLVQNSAGQWVEVSGSNPLPAQAPAQTVWTLLSASQAAANTGTTFPTASVAGVAVDVTLTSFTGGTAPTVTFFVDRLGSDGVWYRVWTSASQNAAATLSQIVGPYPAATGITTAVLTGTSRFGWTSTGAPTGITFSVSISGR